MFFFFFFEQEQKIIIKKSEEDAITATEDKSIIKKSRMGDFTIAEDIGHVDLCQTHFWGRLLQCFVFIPTSKEAHFFLPF